MEKTFVMKNDIGIDSILLNPISFFIYVNY